jgi:chromosome segregation ATPase
MVVALLAGGYFLYSGSAAKDVELVQLRQNSQELEKLRGENAELKKVAAQSEEVERLRKDNEELPRLRGEVRQLREQTKVLNSQLQTAQGQREKVAQQQQQYQQLVSENQTLRNQSQELQQASNQASLQAQLNACVNNLRQIEGAKQQWALENKKSPGSIPTTADLAPYFPQNVFPVCPAGGGYTLNTVSAQPVCSVRGHSMPQQ